MPCNLASTFPLQLPQLRHASSQLRPEQSWMKCSRQRVCFIRGCSTLAAASQPASGAIGPMPGAAAWNLFPHIASRGHAAPHRGCIPTRLVTVSVHVKPCFCARCTRTSDHCSAHGNRRRAPRWPPPTPLDASGMCRARSKSVRCNATINRGCWRRAARSMSHHISPASASATFRPKATNLSPPKTLP